MSRADENLVVCPLCGGSLGARLPYPGQREVFGVLEIALCTICGAGTVIPAPNQALIDRFYESGAYWHGSADKFQHAHEFSQAMLRTRCVQPFLPPDRALMIADIGAGHGGIPRALLELGLSVSTYSFVEPDVAAAMSITACKAPFTVVPIDTVELLPLDQDLVFLSHVLEHVANPRSVLAAAAARVRAGGLLYVETPHADYRFKVDVFPHLHFFTSSALRRLGASVGLEVVSCDVFGLEPSPRATPVGVLQRVAARAFRASVRLGWRSAQRFLDRIVWRYATSVDGIWVRALFRKPISEAN